MPRPDLLPGVNRAATNRRVVFQSRRIITRAKLRASLRDGAQLLFLGCIDWYFAHWQYARLPLLDRQTSLLMLLIANAAALTYVILARLMPYMRARRIAKTWSEQERQRVFRAQAGPGVSRASRATTKR